jgi:hypothetical protein
VQRLVTSDDRWQQLRAGGVVRLYCRDSCDALPGDVEGRLEPVPRAVNVGSPG